MSNSFIYDNEDDLDEIFGKDEDEQDEQEEEIDDRGVSVIYEDEEVERINEDNFLFSDFPNYYEILNEGNSIDEVPENLDEAKQEIYRKGIKQIQAINKRCGCSMSFVQIMKYLDNQYAHFTKTEKTEEKIFNAMCSELMSLTGTLSKDAESRIAYSDISERTIKNDLEQNFKDFSKVVRLYPLLHPERFPRELAVIPNEAKDYARSYYIFTTKGKLRDVFKMNGTVRFNSADMAYDLKSKSKEVSIFLYGSNNRAQTTERFVYNKVKQIIESRDKIHNSQGDRVRKLAECVRLLRPIQAKREKRTFLDFIINHKVYVAERDVLRKCKQEMTRLGLDRTEISKVLHGGTFQDVKFIDGMTVRRKMMNPNEKDILRSTEVVKQEDNIEINLDNNKIQQIIVEDAANLDDSKSVSNEIIEEEVKEVKIEKTN